MKFLILILLNLQLVFGACIHDVELTGAEIFDRSEDFDISVRDNEGRYQKANYVLDFKTDKKYKVQLNRKVSSLENNDAYNKRYLDYYSYERMNRYLSHVSPRLRELGYQVKVVGKSNKGRNLYGVYPISRSRTKKTILMFGRHHGDEGTANWIIEGFLNSVLDKNNTSWHNEYQLVLYPMVNPDGAEAHTRYNANRYDLNRVWTANATHGKDEISYIHGHLRSIKTGLGKIHIALDMHGSINERDDFIFRVDRNFSGQNFYNSQQKFISELGSHDTWQKGQTRTSNGSPGMARIVLVKHYGLNALTHETPRDIKRNNSYGRSIRTLLAQGHAIFRSINNLY